MANQRILINERDAQWRMPHSAWIKACKASDLNRVSKGPEDERQIVDAFISAGRGADLRSTPPAAAQAVYYLENALACARRAIHYEVRDSGAGVRTSAIEYTEEALRQLRQAMADEKNGAA